MRSYQITSVLFVSKPSLSVCIDLTPSYQLELPAFFPISYLLYPAISLLTQALCLYYLKALYQCLYQEKMGRQEKSFCMTKKKLSSKHTNNPYNEGRVLPSIFKIGSKYLLFTMDFWNKYQENRNANRKGSNKINRPSSKEETLVINNCFF